MTPHAKASIDPKAVPSEKAVSAVMAPPSLHSWQTPQGMQLHPLPVITGEHMLEVSRGRKSRAPWRSSGRLPRWWSRRWWS